MDEIDDDFDDEERPRKKKEKPKRKRRRASSDSFFDQFGRDTKALMGVGGLCIVFILISLAAPALISLPLVVGIILIVISNLLVLGVAYSESGIQLLLVWFVPFYVLYFIVTRREECMFPIQMWILGFFVTIISTVVGAITQQPQNRRSALPADSAMVSMMA